MNSLKRESQLKAIRSLTGLLPKSSWWIAGGWAIEALSGVSRDHDDIDIYVLEGNISSAIKEIPFIDLHSIYRENNFFVERRILEISHPGIPAGTEVIMWIPLEAMEGPVQQGIPLVSPEFLYLIAQISIQIFSMSRARAKEKKALKLLKGLIDQEKFKRISSSFRYQLKER